MKTCKTGCGKMQAGGSVKKVKKMQKGGSADIFGMPQYGNNPRTYSGRMAKKGGPIKKMKAGGVSDPCPKGYHWDGKLCKENMLHTLSSKLGVGTFLAGATGIGVKRIADKIKEKKAAKKAAEEKKKKEAATPKAKFGASVAVKASCKQGMVRGADGKCVMSRPKFKSGGFPDLNKDGKITKADILKGRGVIKKMGGSTKRK